jgi:aspartate carbamoyltransferase regulatory subunit
VFKVIDILNLENHDNIISIAANLQSKKMGKKGIVKVGGRNLTKKEVDKISVIAPDATISIIKDYNVKSKKRVSMPEEFTGVIRCPNPKCITNIEPTTKKFNVIDKKPLKLRCEYCERVIDGTKVELI